ncbi:hypothetical protein L7F22_020822 [Adiantum nelumboides]|nr:hypothetical protein [Adiantum nelumboides]
MSRNQVSPPRERQQQQYQPPIPVQQAPPMQILRLPPQQQKSLPLPAPISPLPPVRENKTVSIISLDEKGKEKVKEEEVILPKGKGKDKENKQEEVDAMPIKRARQEEIANSEADTRRKTKESEEGSKKKTKPRLKLTIKDFALGESSQPYDLVDDVSMQGPKISWLQLLYLSLKVCRQWSKMVSTRRVKTKAMGLVSRRSLKDIVSVVDAYVKGQSISNIYVDGGAQICDEHVFHRLGLKISAPAPYKAKKANNVKAVIANGPFEKWGIDAMGPLPRTANGKLYILVAIDYMTRFGTPLEIVSDNGPGIIRKMVESKPKRWDNFLDGAIWAYKTTYRDATQFTPFHLVYGQEALQPIELNIPTIKLTGRQEQSNDEAWIDRLLNLVELEWKREAAYHCYEKKALQLKDKLNEGIKDKQIKEKSLVLRYNNALDNRFDAKFERRWEGPFIVKKAFTGGYYQLIDLNGKEHSRKVNGYRLKPYLSRILPAVFETKQVSKKTKKIFTATFDSILYQGVIAILGRQFLEPSGAEMAIVGGTGRFRLARGFLLFKAPPGDDENYYATSSRRYFALTLPLTSSPPPSTPTPPPLTLLLRPSTSDLELKDSSSSSGLLHELLAAAPAPPRGFIIAMVRISAATSDQAPLKYDDLKQKDMKKEEEKEKEQHGSKGKQEEEEYLKKDQQEGDLKQREEEEEDISETGANY